MDNNTSFHISGSPSCFHFPDPNFHQVSHRFTTNMVTAVINIATAPVAVVANILVASAIFSCSRLRTPSNLLIGCLAVSDVLVGFTAQPGYIAFRLMENERLSVPCFVTIAYSSAFYICFGVSFMTLGAVSYERFVAVRLPVRYNTFFSSRRVFRYILGIWLLNIMLNGLQWAKINQVARGIHLVVWMVCLAVSGATQIVIFVIVRRRRRQVEARLQASQNTYIRRMQVRETRLARSISIIVGIYLILNLPLLVVTFYHQILQLNLPTYNYYSWTETLGFLNSCSNPFICCWRNRQICQKVKSLLKKMLCCSVLSQEGDILTCGSNNTQ